MANPTSQPHLPVLVIDDNETDRELTTRYLGKAWPFEREMAVDYAADGREALRKMQAKRYALVILDWKLPVMDGDEVLRAMRGNSVRVPVVVISGLERNQIRDDLPALQASFLNKDAMNATTFPAAIAESLRLLGFRTVTPAN